MTGMPIELMMMDAFRNADDGDDRRIDDDKDIHWTDYNMMSIELLMTVMSIASLMTGIPIGSLMTGTSIGSLMTEMSLGFPMTGM